MGNGYKRRFYAVNGSNAVAVFDNWSQVEFYLKYFKAFKNKRFDSFAEAERYALEQCELVYIPTGRVTPETLECNTIVFFKDCLRI